MTITSLRFCTKVSQLRHMKKCYLSKLDMICIYLSLFRILTIVPKRGIFAPLTSWGKKNERAIRFEFRDNNTKYEELLRQLRLSTLQNRRLIKMVTSVSKFMPSNNELLCISGFISCRKVSFILRGNNRLILPSPKQPHMS